MKLDEDAKMKLCNSISMALMFVKIIMACFPFLVVPQRCHGDVCGNNDKVAYWSYALIPNVLSFMSFVNLYYVQSCREFFLIDKFDEDDEVAEDALNAEIRAPQYKEIYDRILALNKRIKWSNQICLCSFVLNTVGSAVSIFTLTYLDSTTVTVLLTNSMLIHSKLAQIKKTYTCDDLAMSSVSVRQRVYNIIDRDISGREKSDYASDSDDFACAQQDIATTILQVE